MKAFIIGIIALFQSATAFAVERDNTQLSGDTPINPYCIIVGGRMYCF